MTDDFDKALYWSNVEVSQCFTLNQLIPIMVHVRFTETQGVSFQSICYAKRERPCV